MQRSEFLTTILSWRISHWVLLLFVCGCVPSHDVERVSKSGPLNGLFFYTLTNGVFQGAPIRLNEIEERDWRNVSVNINEDAESGAHREDFVPSLPGLIYILVKIRNGKENELARVNFKGELLPPYSAHSSNEEMVGVFFRQLISEH